MKSWLYFFIVAGLVSGAVGCASPSGVPIPGPAKQSEMRVVDLEILSTNTVRVGTDTLSMAATKDYLVSHRQDIDAAVLHGRLQETAPASRDTETLSRILRTGIPLLIVEPDGEESWREQPRSDNIRTITVKTDQLAAWRAWRKGRKATAGPAVETTLQLDEQTGTYELHRVEVGLFGRRVWLVHEQPEPDGDSAPVGIWLKKTF